MPSQYRVEKIVKQDEWKGEFGPMKGYILTCRDLATDRVGNVAINCKPENSYEVGQSFWAETAGEKAGILKLKRVAPPREASMRGTPTTSGPESQGAIPYVKALAVYKIMANAWDREDGWPHEYATTMFLAWVRGQIGDPPILDASEPSPSPWQDAPFPEE